MRAVNVIKTIETWDDLVSVQSAFDRSKEEWVFRGESKRQPPKSSLQRVCEQFGIQRADIPRLEAMLLNDFRRHAPGYYPPLAQERENTIFLLSLMRHYGAPTRFLDFTYSFFVSVFFALEHPSEAKDENGKPKPQQYEDAAVWAISKSWLSKHSTSFMKRIGGLKLCRDWGERKSSAFETLFWKQRPPQKYVFAANPYLSHERLRIQQGVFLCPGDVSVSFEDNLLQMPGYEDSVRLVLIRSACRRVVLSNLYATGLHRGSLFPGLEGYAGSLCTTIPLLFLKFNEMEKHGTRVPIDKHGNFDWGTYLKKSRRVRLNAPL